MKRKTAVIIIVAILVVVALLFFVRMVGYVINDSEEDIFQNLPSDFNEKPCGFYFKEYQVCGGSCPNGECVNEKNSCFCKLV
jgi:hypothetical protein